jgi:hypothetical protein
MITATASISERARALAPADGDAGEIGHHRVELTVRAGGERGLQALLELFGQQAPLGGRLAKPLGDLLAVGVRCLQGRSP